MTIAVIGRGLIGAAAARHLAEAGHDVVLIGTPEPEDKASHDGVFASHYDSGRITRGLDPDPFWSRVSLASIARYRDIEARSGIPFYNEVGLLMVGPETGAHIHDVKSVADAAGIAVDGVAGGALSARFADFDFPAGSQAYFEPIRAGHINPRAMVRAQVACAVAAGATLVEERALGLDETGAGVQVRTESGVVKADRVLIAAGGYTAALSPVPLPLTVYARTVALFEISEGEAARLTGLPSMIYLYENGEDCYMLPPIRYPDGRIYLKLGGDPKDIEVRTPAEVNAWFKGGGSVEVAQFLEREMRRLMPRLDILSVQRDACVVTYAPNNRPIIDRVSDRVAVAVGGCGKGAKNADELGRMGGAVLLGQDDFADCRLR